MQSVVRDVPTRVALDMEVAAARIIADHSLQGTTRNAARNRARVGYFRSISIFSLLPLWETAIMMPRPIAITTPITVHVVPMLYRIHNFQSAARTPPMRTTKPTRYITAHFTINL